MGCLRLDDLRLPALLALLLLAPALARAQDGEDAPEGADEPAGADDGAADEGRHGDGQPDLVALIDPLLRARGLAGTRMSIFIGRADGGEPLYTFQPDEALHPASNTKLITTAAALHILGPAYSFHTDLVAGSLDDGTADRVYLVGGGDPFFVAESLWKLVDDARDAGLRRVKGDVIVDESYFGPVHLPPGYDKKPDDDASYRAATGAASLNFNSIVVRIEPGSKPGAPVRVSTRPDTDYAIIDNDATTTDGGKERISLTAKTFKDRTKLIVRGRMPQKHAGLSVRRRIDNPPLFTGLALQQALKDAGIKVGGKVRIGSAPEKRRLIARHDSPPLGKLVDDVNKFSNNFMAEHLLRTLGAEKGGGGGFDQGRSVVEGFLKKDVGLERFTYANGSGLFGDTAFTARQFGLLLRFMHGRRPAMPEFAASLAIAGVDGTLRRRLRKLAPGQVRAKTGTLDGVICISGYIELGDGTPAVFSILVNDLKGAPWKVWRMQDQILEALAGYRPGRD
ncbi:MAG: D-alanyl-D-alanine carboxypeptidase/D-alanyl-D-alanine-endopeptidase [bacterium]